MLNKIEILGVGVLRTKEKKRKKRITLLTDEICSMKICVFFLLRIVQMIKLQWIIEVKFFIVTVSINDTHLYFSTMPPKFYNFKSTAFMKVRLLSVLSCAYQTLMVCALLLNFF